MRVVIELTMRQPSRRDVCFCNFWQSVRCCVERVALLASLRIEKPLCIFNAVGDPLVRVARDLRDARTLRQRSIKDWRLNLMHRIRMCRDVVREFLFQKVMHDLLLVMRHLFRAKAPVEFEHVASSTMLCKLGRCKIRARINARWRGAVR